MQELADRGRDGRRSLDTRWFSDGERRDRRSGRGRDLARELGGGVPAALVDNGHGVVAGAERGPTQTVLGFDLGRYHDRPVAGGNLGGAHAHRPGRLQAVGLHTEEGRGAREEGLELALVGLTGGQERPHVQLRPA